MSKLVDPSICPDCRAPLGADAVCTGCGLRLAGPVATDLWHTMQAADALVERLRAQPAGVPTAAPSVTASVAATTGGLPSAPPLPPAHGQARSGLPSASVPVILLTLGALCLLVAAVVFVAVAWGSLSLSAKTAILLGLTVLLIAAAAAVTRRDLRGAAETLWVVVAGMLAVDLVSAVAADLAGLGDLSARNTAVMVGLALLALAAGADLWSRSTPLRTVHALTGVAWIGAVVLAAGGAWSRDGAVPTAVSVPVLAVGGLLLARVLTWQGRAVGSVAALSWLVLLGHGVDRLADQGAPPSPSWWTGPEGWPLLAAALLAAVPTVPLARIAVPRVLAYAGASGALLALALFAIGPDGAATPDVLQASAAALGLAAVALAAPAVWARPAGALSGIATVIAAGLLVLRTIDAAERITYAADETAAPWTAAVLAVVVVVSGLAAGRQLRGTSWHRQSLTLVAALAPGILAGGVGLWVAEADAATAVVAVAWALCVVLLLGAAVLTPQEPVPVTAAVALAHLAAVAGLRLTGQGADTVGEGLAGLAGAVLLLCLALSLPLLGDGRIRAASRLPAEATALFFGTVAVLIPRGESSTAVAATLIGTAIALVAALDRERWWAGWLAAPYLAAAMLIRLDAGLELPEIHTLPAAAVLLVAGGYRMATDSRAESLRALGSGLTLALAPSLLLALDDPVSLRGLLVGVGGLAAVAAGVGLRWAAPLLAGALTVAALAVSHLWPIAEALPRWITLGSLGVLLLLVGVTWEARLRNVQTARRYLTALR